MRIVVATAAALLFWGGALGCVRHVHLHREHPPGHARGHADTVVLEKEHDDKTIVVFEKKPRHRRACWKHRHHWHCRVR